MLGEAAVRGLIDCIFKICTKMDVRWSKGCDIPTSESSHVQPLTSYFFLLKITDEGSVPEMHLSRSLFLYFNNSVSFNAGGSENTRGHM